MQLPQNIRIEDFTYHLPDERIAKYPLEQRDESKLLIYRDGDIESKQFSTLPEQLNENTLLVFNNTKVIRARLYFYKLTGAKIEVFCLEPEVPRDYNLSFQAKGEVVWRCMVGNLKKWKSGCLHLMLENGEQRVQIAAEKIDAQGADQIVRFTWDDDLSFGELLELTGELPIPPYLNRKTEERDLTTYQTVYSKIKGSVAAPTAGLHFTENVMAQMIEQHIKMEEVTLHVGAGTFQPVKSKTMADHPMHAEVIEVTRAFIESLIAHDGPVIPVGTTSVRTLESLYWLGLEASEGTWDNIPVLDQWAPYRNETTVSKKAALAKLIDYLDEVKSDVFRAETRIIIAPGYDFKIISGMITNFHQPKSTLLLLVSALVGEDWRNIYDHALNNDYRFLSYGDSSLLLAAR